MPCNLYTSCLDTFLYLSVICICFNVCMGVIPSLTHKFITVFGPLRQQKSSFSSIFKKQWCIYNLPHSDINKFRRSKLDMLTSAARAVFAHFRVTVSKTAVKRKCYDYISKQILTWSVHPYLGLSKCCYYQNQHFSSLQIYFLCV